MLSGRRSSKFPSMRCDITYVLTRLSHIYRSCPALMPDSQQWQSGELSCDVNTEHSVPSVAIVAPQVVQLRLGCGGHRRQHHLLRVRPGRLRAAPDADQDQGADRARVDARPCSRKALSAPPRYIMMHRCLWIPTSSGARNGFTRSELHSGMRHSLN